jgi:hypothetical protein
MSDTDTVDNDGKRGGNPELAGIVAGTAGTLVTGGIAARFMGKHLDKDLAEKALKALQSTPFPAAEIREDLHKSGFKIFTNDSFAKGGKYEQWANAIHEKIAPLEARAEGLRSLVKRPFILFKEGTWKTRTALGAIAVAGGLATGLAAAAISGRSASHADQIAQEKLASQSADRSV